MTQNTPLSANYYVEPKYFEIDKEQIFFRTWQCVCHVPEVSGPGDYATLTIVDEDVFVMRDKDGGLNAYYNICRHRGHPIVEGRGKGKRVLVCPYHAWTYEVNGKLRRAPGSVPSDNLSCDQINLRKIQVDILAATDKPIEITDDAMSALHDWGAPANGPHGGIQWVPLMRMLDRTVLEFRS